MTIRKMISALVAIVVVISCSKGRQPGNEGGNTPPVDCSQINAGFAAEIFPLVQARCATDIGCHAAGSLNGPGPLTNFNQIKNAAVSIQVAVTSRQMPLGSSLTSSQIAQVNCWVQNGGLNN